MTKANKSIIIAPQITNIFIVYNNITLDKKINYNLIGTEIDVITNQSKNIAKIIAFNSLTKYFKIKLNDSIKYISPEDVKKYNPNLYVEIPKENIKRESDIIIIGDLHGSIEGFFENLKSVDILDKYYNWQSGNKKLVFLGDILGDRNDQGIEILLQIKKLKQQAQKVNGDIIILAGNHDDFAIAYLLNENIAKGNNIKQYIQLNTIDIKSFFKLFPAVYRDKNPENNLYLTNPFCAYTRKYLLKLMKKSQIGKIVLDMICNFQLIEYIDDTLLVHTDFTKQMASLILQYSPEEINSIYQQGLKEAFFENKQFSEVTNAQLFNIIRNEFLYTGNRYYNKLNMQFSDNIITTKQAKNFKKYGINQIIHGHSNNSEDLRVFDIESLKIISIDYNAFKHDDKKYKNIRSIGIIEKTGTIKIGIDKKEVA